MIIKDDKDSMKRLKFFMESWLEKAKPEYGLSEDEVPNYIPKPLRDLYLFAGNWPHPLDEEVSIENKQPGIFQNGQDILMGIDNIERKNGKLSFMMENQCNWTCEVEENNDDSYVYSDASCVWDENSTGQEVVCKSLSHFLVTFCLQELLYGSQFVGTIDDKLRRESLLKKSVPIWLDGYYVFKEPSHSFYICENRMLIMDYAGFWYGTDDESALSLVY